MDRDEELALAKRLSLARLRFGKARLAEGMEDQSLEAILALGAGVPGELQKRARELQRLRVEMVERHLYLIPINVERYARRCGQREDLMQEGSMALFRAVDRFDWQRGVLFRTYAVHWVHQAFRSFLYNHGQLIRVPVYLQKALQRFRGGSYPPGELEQQLDAFAAQRDLSPDLMRAALGARRAAVSLDASVDREQGLSLGDQLEDEQAEWGYSNRLESVFLEGELHRALSDLPERDRCILQMRYGIGQDHESTLAEVAERYGISLERVRQIQARALRNLGTVRLRRELEPFLN